MSAALVQGTRVKAPFDVGANEYNVKKFTAGTTHLAHALPADWAGKYVRIYFIGAAATDYLHFGFSKSSAAEIDRAVAATDAGASAKVGGILKADQDTFRLVPIRTDSESVYFVREATSAACTVILELTG
jgi:hypothetical protein